jgi:hypothetical protein
MVLVLKVLRVLGVQCAVRVLGVGVPGYWRSFSVSALSTFSTSSLSSLPP